MRKSRISCLWSQMVRPFTFLSITCFLLPLTLPGQEQAHSPGWVVLPIDDYRSLYARAYPAAEEPEPPTVDATLTRIDYDLHVNQEVAIGRANLTIDVLKDGWVRIPIPAG